MTETKRLSERLRMPDNCVDVTAQHAGRTIVLIPAPPRSSEDQDTVQETPREGHP
jgi:hypothetical protein